MDTREYEDWWSFATLITAHDTVSKNPYHSYLRGWVRTRWGALEQQLP